LQVSLTMELKNPLAPIAKRVAPSRHKKIEKAVTITAGVAATVWAVLRLRRELYGPGGTKLSRYNPDVDKAWKRDR
jgi:hypothetical protein